jgi:outer membrane protein TolC
VKTIALVALGLSLTTLAYADALPASEDALVAFALAHSPALRASRAERKTAEAQEITAGALENPVLRLEWLHANAGDVGDMGWGVGLSWQPPRPGEWSARKKEARAHTLEVTEDNRERAADLEAAIRIGWASAQALGEQLEAATRAVDSRRALEQLVEQRVLRGASTRVELSVISLSVARAEQERDALSVEKSVLEDRLSGLAGLPALGSVDVPNSAPQAPGPPPDTKALETRALADRPLLRADAARAEKMEQAIRAERARSWPWFDLAAAPRYRFNDQASRRHDLTLAIDVSIPVFDGNGGRIAAAESERDKQAALREAHIAEVGRDIAIARREVERGSAMLERHLRTVEPLLKQHATLLAEALANRQVDLTALLAAEDLALRSRRELAQTRFAYRRACIDLARAVGRLGGAQ